MNTYTGYNIVTASQAFFERYADFSGRSTLSAYWYWSLASAIISFVITFIDGALGFQTGDLCTVSSLWSLLTLVPSVALTVRRLHDSGKSGWNFCWVILPIIGWIVLFVFVLKDSQQGSNKWGASEKYPEA